MKVGTYTFPGLEIFLLYKGRKGWHSFRALFLLMFFDASIAEIKFHGFGGMRPKS